MSGSNIEKTPPSLTRDGEERVFAEPWEAEALALSIRLLEEGHFSANEWSQTLGAEIRAAQERGDPDDGTTYYRHVLAALERLVCKKGLTSRELLERRRLDWEQAYSTTPHGEPVTLRRTRGTGE